MSKYLDIYQKILSIPMGSQPSDRERVWKILGGVIDDLENLKVRETGSKKELIPEARLQYLKSIQERTRHYYKSCKKYHDSVSHLSFIPSAGKNEQRLRDFHHNVYYATFFAARFLLVKEKMFDCTEHKIINDYVKEISKKARRSGNASLGHDYDRVGIILGNLKDNRNKADYIINMSYLTLLASPATISSSFSEVHWIISRFGI